MARAIRAIRAMLGRWGVRRERWPRAEVAAAGVAVRLSRASWERIRS